MDGGTAQGELQDQPTHGTSGAVFSDLANLPSKGNLTALQTSCVVAPPGAYIAVTTTSFNVVKNDDSTESLIRIIKGRKPSASKPASGNTVTNESKGKRTNEDYREGLPSKKVNTTQAAAGTVEAGGSRQVFTQDELNKKTAKELQQVLKARSLPVTGRKEELVRRIVDYQRRLKRAA